MLHTCTSLTLLVLSWIEGMFWEEIIEQKSSLLRPTCSPTPSSTAHLGFVSQHTVHATKTLTIVPFLFRILGLLLQVCRLQCSLLSKTCPRLERRSERASKAPNLCQAFLLLPTLLRATQRQYTAVWQRPARCTTVKLPTVYEGRGAAQHQQSSGKIQAVVI